MATTSHPHTPPREPKTKRDAALDNFGLGSDDEDTSRLKLPERSDIGIWTKGQEDDEPGSTCRGGKRQKLPWAKRLKKAITYDTDIKIDLGGHLSDLVQGVAIEYDHRKIGQELNELGAEYAEGKSGHPLEERSLFTLTGKAGKAGLTTEHRLSIAAARSKPELGRFIADIERSAPAGLKNETVQVRMMPRSTGVGMTAHRDGIALSYDRVVFTIHTEYTAAPAQFFCKLMSTADARPDRGPYEKEQRNIQKVNGLVLVQGPKARGEETRVVHGVTGGGGGAITAILDYATSRIDESPVTEADRDHARKSVVTSLARDPDPPRPVANTYANTCEFPADAPRSSGSRRGTEANNAMVPNGRGGLEKRAVQKGAAGTLYGREKGGDGRSLSSEQGASIRPADTSAQWTEHAVEEPLRAEPATCSNCEEPRELSWFFYGGGTRRVVVLDHKVGLHRCNKYAIKPRGVFKPTDEKVKTITKDGIRKAVRREAKRGAKKASGGN
ncbi:unnamed protein product [Ectocarpus sp. CCAP 1310/34]|nr:unnamed protein product [Ectocarpus sp. CCAP 1310/34]